MRLDSSRISTLGRGASRIITAGVAQLGKPTPRPGLALMQTGPKAAERKRTRFCARPPAALCALCRLAGVLQLAVQVPSLLRRTSRFPGSIFCRKASD
jgi:hypothetical protein